MAHLIENMAYVGDVPWHQLGNALPPKQPIEVWAEKAGMDWSILETPVCFMAEKAGALGSIKTFPDQKVLFRSDSHKPLSVVSERYQVVQRELAALDVSVVPDAGFSAETQALIRSELAKVVGDSVEIRIHPVDDIAASASGKFRVAICELD